MKIRYVTGSILDAAEPYIMHGCNAQGKMGSGVAKVIFERYPNVRTEYLRRFEVHRAQGIPFLGTYHFADNEPHVVINAITQEFYGKDGGFYVSYEAIEKIFSDINQVVPRISEWSKTNTIPEMTAIGLPLIGCGLAGGDWNVVSEIIERVVENFEPVVYLPDGKLP